VIASVIEIPGDDVGVVAFGTGSDCLEVVGKVGQPERSGRPILGMSVLVIKARRGCSRICQPLDHYVCEDVVEAYGVSVDLIVPGKLANRRVGQGVSQGLWHGGL
jgi:hypothetical protein